MDRGHNGCSSSISDSKQNEVFVKELFAPNGVWEINDTLQMHVHSAWIEHCWKYAGMLDDPIQISGYQILVEVDADDMIGYNKTWMIGYDQFGYFRSSSKSSLISDVSEIPNDSLLVWKVQKGNSLSPFHDTIIIGEVRLK